MLAQALRRGNGATKKCFLMRKSVDKKQRERRGQLTMMFMVVNGDLRSIDESHLLLLLASMDLLQIGSQCSHSSCDQIDFLPILCRCSKYFCRHHITSYRHSCPIDLAANDPTTGLFHNIQRCAINTCGKPSLNVSNSNDSDLKNACPQCRKSFCAV
jgi:hypothetical protein